MEKDQSTVLPAIKAKNQVPKKTLSSTKMTQMKREKKRKTSKLWAQLLTWNRKLHEKWLTASLCSR